MPSGGRAWYTDEDTLVWPNPVLRTTPSPCVILCCSILRADSVGSLRQVQFDNRSHYPSEGRRSGRQPARSTIFFPCLNLSLTYYSLQVTCIRELCRMSSSSSSMQRAQLYGEGRPSPSPSHMPLRAPQAP